MQMLLQNTVNCNTRTALVVQISQYDLLTMHNCSEIRRSLTSWWVAEWWQCRRNVKSCIQWRITSSNTSYVLQWNVRWNRTTTKTELEFMNRTRPTLTQYDRRK